MPKEIAGIRFYTVDEIAKELDISPVTVKKYINEDQLRAAVLGHKYFVSEEALKTFLLTPQKMSKKPRKKDAVSKKPKNK